MGSFDNADAGVGITGEVGERCSYERHAPVAAWRAAKKPAAETWPIQLVPVVGPKQLQLKVRSDGVGLGLAGDGTTASEGNPSAGTGGGSWLGPLGTARGAVNGLGGGNWAHSKRRSYGSAITRKRASGSATATMSFNTRIRQSVPYARVKAIGIR